MEKKDNEAEIINLLEYKYSKMSQQELLILAHHHLTKIEKWFEDLFAAAEKAKKEKEREHLTIIDADKKED